MKPPKLLRIGPFDYEVLRGAFSTLELASRDRVGECDYSDLTIRVSHQLAPGQQRETLLHEALHAVADLAGLPSELGADLDEKIVRRLAPLLLALMRDNPKLVAFLTEP